MIEPQDVTITLSFTIDGENITPGFVRQQLVNYARESFGMNFTSNITVTDSQF